MQEHQKQDLLEKYQILGLLFMMMSKTPEDCTTWLSKSLAICGIAKAGLKR